MEETNEDEDGRGVGGGSEGATATRSECRRQDLASFFDGSSIEAFC